MFGFRRDIEPIDSVQSDHLSVHCIAEIKTYNITSNSTIVCAPVEIPLFQFHHSYSDQLHSTVRAAVVHRSSRRVPANIIIQFNANHQLTRK
jgi:hypothetical protein